MSVQASPRNIRAALNSLHDPCRPTARNRSAIEGIGGQLFPEPVRSRHKQYLIRRIAWRLQANAEGGLSERALRRAEALANDADVRVTAPRWAEISTGARAVRPTTVAVAAATDARLPAVGSQITRPYKGRPIVVTVLGRGEMRLGISRLRCDTDAGLNRPDPGLKCSQVCRYG